jgi:hypothetical protein
MKKQRTKNSKMKQEREQEGRYFAMEFEAVRGWCLVTNRTCLKLARGISSFHSNISLDSHGYIKKAIVKTCVSVGMLTDTYFLTYLLHGAEPFLRS